MPCKYHKHMNAYLTHVRHKSWDKTQHFTMYKYFLQWGRLRARHKSCLNIRHFSACLTVNRNELLWIRFYSLFGTRKWKATASISRLVSSFQFIFMIAYSRSPKKKPIIDYSISFAILSFANKPEYRKFYILAFFFRGCPLTLSFYHLATCEFVYQVEFYSFHIA